MSDLPGDPIMLLSVINTKLRDTYPGLTELCEACGVDEADIKSRLSSVGYEYDPEENRFR